MVIIFLRKRWVDVNVKGAIYKTVLPTRTLLSAALEKLPTVLVPKTDINWLLLRKWIFFYLQL